MPHQISSLGNLCLSFFPPAHTFPLNTYPLEFPVTLIPCDRSSPIRRRQADIRSQNSPLSACSLNLHDLG